MHLAPLDCSLLKELQLFVQHGRPECWQDAMMIFGSLLQSMGAANEEGAMYGARCRQLRPNRANTRGHSSKYRIAMRLSYISSNLGMTNHLVTNDPAVL